MSWFVHRQLDEQTRVHLPQSRRHENQNDRLELLPRRKRDLIVVDDDKGRERQERPEAAGDELQRKPVEGRRGAAYDAHERGDNVQV